MTSDPAEPEIMEDDVPDPKNRRAPAAGGPVRSAAPGPVSRRSDAPAPPRRPGVVNVRDRRHVDLLLLAAATKGPASGHELTDLVGEWSDGRFLLPFGTVIRQVHRLANNRLMQVTGEQGARRYSLTPLGERVLATRRREWEAFSQAFTRVLDAADDIDPRDAGRERPVRASRQERDRRVVRRSPR